MIPISADKDKRIMKKSDIEILICEDDPSLGPAIVEALNRVGYQTTLVTNGSRAIPKIKSGYFLCYIIDCMLPGQNGVDVARSVRVSCGNTVHIILTSGIFKEESFVQQAVHSVNAKSYLTKPFNTEILIKTVDDCFKDEINAISSPLETFVNQPKNSYGHIIENNELYGFKLPLLLIAAIEGELSGFLELHCQNSEVSGRIHFHKGYISAVESNDKKSLFGDLLVENGFITKEEIEESFDKHRGKKLIGEYLVETNCISPHSIQIIMVEQMKIRIGQLIQDTTYSATLTSEETLPHDMSIDTESFYLLLDNWVKTKLDPKWLEEHLLELSHHFLSGISPLLNGESISPLVFSELEKLSQMEAPLQRLLEKTNGEAKESYPDIYLMILSRKIHLRSSGLKDKPYSLQIRRLKELIALSDEQTYYERLRINRSATIDEVNSAHLKLTQLLNYTNAPVGSPKELGQLSRKMISLLEEARRILSDADRREQYLSKLTQSDSTTHHTKVDLDVGYSALISGDYKRALKIFESMAKTPSNYDKWGLYYLWAEIKCNKEPDEDFIKRVQRELLKIPIPYTPMRHSHYHIVKGLCYKLCEDYIQAKNCFEHAYGIDPTIPEIKREIRSVNQLIRDQEDLSKNSRINTFISSILKKKVG